MSERLNVILAVIEGARADHLSCYGYRRQTTPFLDRLGRDGIRFPFMITAAPGALPAHASLFTGLFSSAHGAIDENRVLADRFPVLAEILRDAGYRTAAFCTDPSVSPATGLGRGFEVFHTQLPTASARARATICARETIDRVLHRRDSGARRTNLAFRRWVASGGEQPFFAFLHYREAQFGSPIPPPYDRVFLTPDVSRVRLKRPNQDWAHLAEGHPMVSGADFEILTSRYDGALRYVDSGLGELAVFLESLGQWDRTVCLVTADHGVHLGEHALIGHNIGLYDPVLRVPLLIRCPGALPQGYVIDEFAQTVDLLPTLTHLLGIDESTPSVHGRPLISGGRATQGPVFAVTERFRPRLPPLAQRFPGVDVEQFAVRQKCVRTKREKFVWRSDEENEYFDLLGDPAENHSVLFDAPDAAEACRRQLFDWLASIDRTATDEPGSEVQSLTPTDLYRMRSRA